MTAEDALREALDDLDARIARGKGTYLHPRYIPDDLWECWQAQRLLLMGILKRADDKRH